MKDLYQTPSKSLIKVSSHTSVRFHTMRVTWMVQHPFFINNISIWLCTNKTTKKNNKIKTISTINSLICSLVCLFVCLFVRSFVCSFFFYSIAHSFIYSFNYYLISSFFHARFHIFVHYFVHWTKGKWVFHTWESGNCGNSTKCIGSLK